MTKIFNESYTQEENLLVENFLETSSTDELIEALDWICSKQLPKADEKFLPFYQYQLTLLKLKKENKDDFIYKKKYKKYLEKMIEYQTKETLKKPFLEEYKTYKKESGLSRDSMEDSFIEKTASEQLTKLKSSKGTTNEYRKYIEQIFGKDNYISHEDFIKIIRNPRKSHPLVKPEKEDNPSQNTDALKIMEVSLLKYLLIQMIGLLGNEDISAAYPIWIFTVAQVCYSNPDKHRKGTRPYSSSDSSLSTLINENRKLEEEIQKLESILNIAKEIKNSKE